MKKTRALAGLLVLALMLVCMSLFALTVSAAGGTDGAPQAVTADIRNDGSETAQAGFDGDNAPAVQKTSSSSSGKDHSLGRAIVAGIIVALIGTAIFMFTTINGYKNNGKTEPYPFSSKAPLNLAVKEDILVNTEVTKRKIENNSNNK